MLCARIKENHQGMASRCGGSSPVVYGALLAEQPPAADAFQRPLRSRFQAPALFNRAY